MLWNFRSFHKTGTTLAYTKHGKNSLQLVNVSFHLREAKSICSTSTPPPTTQDLTNSRGHPSWLYTRPNQTWSLHKGLEYSLYGQHDTKMHIVLFERGWYQKGSWSFNQITLILLTQKYSLNSCLFSRHSAQADKVKFGTGYKISMFAFFPSHFYLVYD